MVGWNTGSGDGEADGDADGLADAEADELGVADTEALGDGATLGDADGLADGVVVAGAAEPASVVRLLVRMLTQPCGQSWPATISTVASLIPYFARIPW